MKLRYKAEARRELREAINYYEDATPGLGERFQGEIEQTINQLLRLPRLGVRLDDRVRRLNLRTFDYCLIYTIEDDTLIIEAVAHQHRKPGYWLHR